MPESTQPQFKSRIVRRAAVSRSSFALLAVLLAALATGCAGRGGWESYDDPPPFTPHAAPVSLGRVNLGSASNSDAGDPQLIRGGDPLAGSADPLAPSSGIGDDTRLADARPLGSAGPRVGRTRGWYWVVGSIESGEIGIAVNGTPVGRYSVHVDKEISAYCHPGRNTLTFTHYPLLGDASPLCAARLSIVNGNAPKGEQPLMTYDTSAEVNLASSAETRAQPPAGSGADDDSLNATAGSNTGALAGGDSPASQNAPAGASSSPFSEQRSFLAQ